MTALKLVVIHAEHFDQNGNSLKIARLYGRNKYELCIINIKILCN